MLVCRGREEKDKFAASFFRFIESSDLGFDFDCEKEEDIRFPQKDALYIVKILQKMDMLPEIRFTGMGFQVVVRYINLINDWRRLSFNPFEKENFFEVTSDWQRSFKNRCPTMDMKTIEPRRVFKVPYSLVYRWTKADKIYVCTPLTIGQLKDFNIQEMEYHG
jgi:hypothetical protein